MSTDDFKSENRIAYDKYLRSKLGELHDMLGVEITDVAVGAVNYGMKFNPEAKDILKTLSSITSDFSVLLVSAKGENKELTEKEQQDFNNIKKLTDYLGNIQFKLNKIIQKSEEFKKLARELEELGVGCAEYIMEAQEEFRNVRAEINDLSYLSVNPSVAYQYEEQLKKEEDK